MTPARRRPVPIPVTVLTGFLGAGKTTFLNRVLSDPALAGTLVLVNEFGEIGLDHLFMEAVGEDVVLLSSGCLCCSVRGELVGALESLLRDVDNDRLAAPRRIVIETTGLADPAPILQTLMSHPYLSLRFTVDTVATVVDAVNGLSTLDSHPESLRQAAIADVLAISKTDLAPPEAVAALKERLAALNPRADVIDSRGADAMEQVFSARSLARRQERPGAIRAWLGRDASSSAPASHRSGRISSFVIACDEPVPAATFDLFLQLLRSAHGAKLLRVKGLVALAERPDRPVVVHGVQHVFHEPVTLEAWPDADHSTRIVFIVQDLEDSLVRRMWDAFLGRPSPDTPDRAAIEANPLALGGDSGLLRG
jgi:G3E family GTPase